jgi:hypothetical protein
MSKKDVNQIVEKLLEKPSYKYSDSGLLSKMWGFSQEDIIEAKRIAKEKTKKSPLTAPHSISPQDIDKAVKYLLEVPGRIKDRKVRELSIKLSVSEDTVRIAKDKAKSIIQGQDKDPLLSGNSVVFFQSKDLMNMPQAECATELESIRKVDEVKGTLESHITSDYDPKNHEELALLHKVDLSRYRISTYYSKLKSTGKFTSTVFCALIREDKQSKEDAILKVLSEYKSTYTPLRKEQIIINEKFSNPTLTYLALTDVHIDKYESRKLALKDKVAEYKNTLQNLVMRAYLSHNIDEILFVIGHDWFNSDTYFGTTTAGTPQTNNSEWDEAYDMGFDTQVWAISFLKQFCNHLVVKFVPGNHDRTKTYFMVHALEQHFKPDLTISFDRKAEASKVHVYGENFIGMDHGETKLENLPLYFSNKFYKQWGQCKYKEIGVGHRHQRKVYKLQLEDTEIDGVRLFMTPSMGGSGRYERQEKYDNSTQAGICRVYDKKLGKISEFECKL